MFYEKQLVIVKIFINRCYYIKITMIKVFFINHLIKIKFLYMSIINISVNIHNPKYLGFDFS